MKNFKKGFTLIELLVVIAIIGILTTIVLVSLTGANKKANTVATKSVLKSLESSLGICCSSTANKILAIPGGDVCNPSINAKLPNIAQLKAVTVVYTGGLCSASTPSLKVVLTGHSNSACNTTAWTITEAKMVPPTGC